MSLEAYRLRLEREREMILGGVVPTGFGGRGGRVDELFLALIINSCECHEVEHWIEQRDNRIDEGYESPRAMGTLHFLGDTADGSGAYLEILPREVRAITRGTPFTVVAEDTPFGQSMRLELSTNISV